jgi:hypothetical protein
MLKVIYNRPSTYRCEGVLLKPAVVTTIPEALADAFMASPGVQVRIKTGQITIVENSKAVVTPEVKEVAKKPRAPRKAK